LNWRTKARQCAGIFVEWIINGAFVRSQEKRSPPRLTA
jgi:hypothetical protein